MVNSGQSGSNYYVFKHCTADKDGKLFADFPTPPFLADGTDMNFSGGADVGWGMKWSPYHAGPYIDLRKVEMIYLPTNPYGKRYGDLLSYKWKKSLIFSYRAVEVFEQAGVKLPKIRDEYLRVLFGLQHPETKELHREYICFWPLDFWGYTEWDWGQYIEERYLRPPDKRVLSHEAVIDLRDAPDYDLFPMEPDGIWLCTSRFKNLVDNYDLRGFEFVQAGNPRVSDTINSD